MVSSLDRFCLTIVGKIESLREPVRVHQVNYRLTFLAPVKPMRIQLAFFFGAGLLLAQPCAAAPFEWQATGDLTFAAVDHTATLLTNGKVLAVGGVSPDYFSIVRSELFDPAAGTWSVSGDLNEGRNWHTATLLLNGKVLVAAGFDLSRPFGQQQLASAELYDSASGTWTYTESLATARSLHTATLLPDGRVLVAGGYQFLTPLAS